MRQGQGRQNHQCGRDWNWQRLAHVSNDWNLTGGSFQQHDKTVIRKKRRLFPKNWHEAVYAIPPVIVLVIQMIPNQTPTVIMKESR